MQIGEAAEKTGLSYHTLRYYENIGLIRHIRRDGSDKRDYSEQDVKWILFLVSLKKTQIPLNDILKYSELYYSGDQNIPDRIKLLDNHRKQLLIQMSELQESVNFLDAKIKFYQNKLLQKSPHSNQLEDCL